MTTGASTASNLAIYPLQVRVVDPGIGLGQGHAGAVLASGGLPPVGLQKGDADLVRDDLAVGKAVIMFR